MLLTSQNFLTSNGTVAADMVISAGTTTEIFVRTYTITSAYVKLQIAKTDFILPSRKFKVREDWGDKETNAKSSISVW